MADAPQKTLLWGTGCGDCAERRVALPRPFPEIDDDFDWMVRDYDSFRLFMMEELAHRFPGRHRWGPADLEVVIVEALAAALDRLSHTLDVIAAEKTLATARRPESLRRLLQFIGYDAHANTPAAALARLPALPAGESETPQQQVERLWRLFPEEMETARAAGPRQIGTQERMVTLDDHASHMTRHPLVDAAKARSLWTGAWNTIMVACLLSGARALDHPLSGPQATLPMAPELWTEIEAFHLRTGLALPSLSTGPTARDILRPLVERDRMIGSEVLLEDVARVPITFWISVQAKPGYFRSELRDSLNEALSSDPGGLFEPGRLGFGADVYASNIVEVVMATPGVRSACLNRFQRLGKGAPDEVDSGVIPIGPDEIALCLNRSDAPAQGQFDITVNGGEAG